jgi:hypothetical protein
LFGTEPNVIVIEGAVALYEYPWGDLTNGSFRHKPTVQITRKVDYIALQLSHKPPLRPYLLKKEDELCTFTIADKDRFLFLFINDLEILCC